MSDTYVVGILGPKGSGKTVLLAYLLYRDSLAGRPIVSNFHLAFDHIQKDFSELVKLPDFLQNATVGYDEFHIAVDSRRSTSKSNIAFDTFLSQIRKRDCILYYTTQIFLKLDVRVREQTDILILPTENDGEIFSYEVRDRFSGNLLNTLNLNMKPVFEANLYNTKEIILFDNEEEKK